MSSTTATPISRSPGQRPTIRIAAASAVVAVLALLASSCQYLPDDSLSTVGIFTTGESSQAVIDEATALGVTTVRNSQDVTAPVWS